MKSLKFINGIVWGAAVLVVGMGILMWMDQPALTETEVRQLVITTIQEEAPASFYVTGVLTIAATSTVEETEYLMPTSFRLPLGSTEATVRMPGQVSYGFGIEALRPEHIRLSEDGGIEVVVPPLSPYSVEPDFTRLQIRTSTGTWQRWLGDEAERDRVQAQAMRQAQAALRVQANEYLQTNQQPLENTERALEKMLTPVLQAGGIESPRFRFITATTSTRVPGR